MNYQHIINPETNRKVSVTSTLGRKILRNYINQTGGDGNCGPHQTTKGVRCKTGLPDPDDACFRDSTTKRCRSRAVHARKSSGAGTGKKSGPNRHSVRKRIVSTTDFGEHYRRSPQQLELSRAVERQCSDLSGDEDGCDRRFNCQSQIRHGKHSCVRRSTRSSSKLESPESRRRHASVARGTRKSTRGFVASDCVNHHGDRSSCEAKDHCQYRKDGRCQKRRSRR